MSFDWRDYLELSRLLVVNNNEASFRSAISRAYYAVFNVLRIHAGYNTRGGQDFSHATFIQQLVSANDDIIQKLPFHETSDLTHIGNELNELRRLRNSCDYDGTTPPTPKIAQDCIEKVEAIFELLDEALEY